MLNTIRDVGGLWSPPVVFTPQNASANPALAVCTDGQMHVLYERTDQQIMYMHRSVAGVWDSAVDISLAPGHYCYIANIAVASNGIVCAGWADGTVSEVFFAVKTDGDTVWSTPYNVSNSATGSWIPKVAIGSDNVIHYIWAENTGAGSGEICYRRRDTLGNWSATVNISNTSGDSRISGLTIDNANKLHILWTEMPDAEVYYDTYPK